jgi:hypothetical protein
MRVKMQRIEDIIDECIRLFGGQVVKVRYTEERKKRLASYLKLSKEKQKQQEKIDQISQ